MEYRECTKLLFDTHDDPNMTFDENGVCNHYYEYLQLEKDYVKYGEEGEKAVEEFVEYAKANKTGKYDCIIGVSGGVDSTYLLYLVKEKLGLNPLAVHFDNGWNSELAVKNIESVTQKLGIDLQTFVIDWEEFKDIQRSYFDAGVVDLEVPTDHAIYGAMYRLAMDNNIKVIFSGVNIVSESIMPHHWSYEKHDHVNLLDIHKRFGKRPIKNFPIVDNKFRKKLRDANIQVFRLLNYVPYKKIEVEDILVNKLGWRPYGGKHYESVFTRFYQGYILPKKFGIDKRKAHLSNLICSGQLTKEEAKKIIAVPDYSEAMQKEDKEYVLKKLDFTEEYFDNYMKKPEVPHLAYLSYKSSLYDKYPILRPLRPIGVIVKKLFNIKYTAVR
ncbi:MAG: N-acetyl sugar amidotransferase [Chitinophagales bacterium]|nr:N-acetyl sugar amidotransferase [Chitinophagaceae bacterium]MCB9064627.1 N-acetyl sugar amidotransferase [Chitinophagales bacterium]